MVKNSNDDIEEQKIKQLQTFILNGGDINQPLSDSTTLLTNAVLSKQNKLVKFLLDNGANVEGTDMYGYTPLMLAAKYNNQESSFNAHTKRS